MTLPVAILAGGLGTRIREVTGDRLPKALIPVAGQPFADHQVRLLVRNGYRDLVFCLGRHGDQIVDVLGDGSRLGAHIRYSDDGPVLRGTGGAVRNAMPLLGSAFFVLYGDSYLDCDYAAVEAAFRAADCDGLNAVYRNANRWDRSNIHFENGRVVRYDKQHPDAAMAYLDYGLLAFHARSFDGAPADPFDLSTLQADLAARGRLAGHEVQQRFHEVGSPTGLADLETHLSGAAV